MKRRKTQYLFDGFWVSFDAQIGSVFTHYPDGSFSGCEPVEEDTFHGDRLGIPPAYHRLAHELAHHLIGIHVLESDTSAVIEADAREVAMTGSGLDLQALGDQELVDYLKWEETLVTALTYQALGRYDILQSQEVPYDEYPLIAIAEKTDLAKLCVMLDWLLETPIGATLDLRGAEW